LRLQRRDNLFATQDGRRFAKPQRNKARSSKLVVDGETVQDPKGLLEIWADHFGKLAESRLGGVSDGNKQRERTEML